jgi:hypothetical protein
MLYVLSIGPVCFLFGKRSPVMDERIDRFYAPAAWVSQKMGFLGPLASYAYWWWELPGGPAERMLRQSTPLPAVNDSVL